MTQQLSALPARRLLAALKQSGLASAEARAVRERGPFADDEALCSAVDAVVLGLDDAALRNALDAVPAPTVELGDPDARDAALLAIRLYRDRFGYAFVSGIETRTSEELLMRVRIRLGNDPDPEGRAAREHLRRFVRRRIQVLQEGGAGS